MAVLTHDQMSLSITASSDGSVDYVRLRGEVDLSDSAGLGLAAQRLINANAGLVYVDLGGVTFMGSTLIGFLHHVAASGRSRRPLVLCRPTAMALRVIQLTGLDKFARLRTDLPWWPSNTAGAHGSAPEGATKTSPGADPINWRERGACRKEDPELFFPMGTTHLALVQLQEARVVCRACPVQEPCLHWALHSEPRGHGAGVLAGLSEDERRALQRLTLRPHQATLAAPRHVD